MKFIKFIAAILFLIGCGTVYAQTAGVTDFCVKGATPATTSGLNSTNTLQGVIPLCTVTVYNTGTTTKATIYSDANNTTLTNPFTATKVGQYTFYAATAVCYDIVLGGGIPPNVYLSPITITDFCVNGGGTGNVLPSPQYRILQQPLVGNQAVAGPTNMFTDATGNNLYVPGTASITNSFSVLQPDIDIMAFPYSAKCNAALTETGFTSATQGLASVWTVTAGATDDTNAIQAAINACPSPTMANRSPTIQGGPGNPNVCVIRFPSGRVCKISNTLTVGMGVGIELNTSTLATTSTATAVKTVPDLSVSYGNFTPFIRNGKIVHADGTVPGWQTSVGSGVDAIMWNNGTIENVGMYGFKYGLLCRQCDYDSFIDMVSENNGFGAVFTGYTDVPTSTTINLPSIDNKITRGSLGRNAHYGIWEQDASWDMYNNVDLNWSGETDVVVGEQLPVYMSGVKNLVGGSSYTTPPTVTITDSYSGGLFHAHVFKTGMNQTPGTYAITGTGGTNWSVYPVITVVVNADGNIGSESVTSPGTCSSTCTAPTFTVAAGGSPGAIITGLCNTATAVAVLTTGAVSTVAMTDAGEYCNNPQVAFSGGGGTGASAAAVIQDDSGIGPFDGTTGLVIGNMVLNDSKMEVGDAVIPQTRYTAWIVSSNARNNRFTGILNGMSQSVQHFSRLMRDDGLNNGLYHPVAGSSFMSDPANPTNFMQVISSQFPGTYVDWGAGWTTGLTAGTLVPVTISTANLIGGLNHATNVGQGTTFISQQVVSGGHTGLNMGPLYIVAATGLASSSPWLSTQLAADTVTDYRFQMSYGGTMVFSGSGSAPADVGFCHFITGTPGAMAVNNGTLSGCTASGNLYANQFSATSYNMAGITALYNDGTNTFIAAPTAGGSVIARDSTGASTTVKAAAFIPSIFTVATLPSASAEGQGAMVIITDCTAFTPGPLCTGGGADIMIGLSNGSVWTVH